MSSMRGLLLALPFLLISCLPATAMAQSGWDPLAGVEKLIAWFSRLNEQVDQVVVVEKRGQLIRLVDRLRKELYALEADTRILMDSIPDSVPTSDEHEYLSRLAEELQETVGRLSHTAREVGADLRLNEAAEVEEALTSGLRTRGAALTYLQTVLQDARQGKWVAADVRSRLGEGLEAVRTAQLAVTAFRRKLSEVI